MYIEREIRKKFNKISKVYLSVAIVGPRQSGKTTFLKEQIGKTNASYVLFDDPDARELFEEDIKKFEKQYVEGFNLAVLDEIQYCKDAGGKIKYLVDKGNKIWLTSSSEIILSKDVLSYLVGRVSILKLYPFSIKEFLVAKKQKQLTEKIFKRMIWEHIIYGGYPKVVLTDDIELKRTILRDLYDTMVLKDIARTFSIEDINSLEQFVKYLSLNIGALISYEDISNSLNLSFQSVKKYLNAMEKSHLIFVANPFFTNKIKEITKQPKIYFIDTGLRNVIAKEYEDVSGKLFENYILSELIKINLIPKYWRTKSKTEVDFIIEKEKDIIPIEVKLNPSKISAGLHAFIKTYKPKRAFVIFYKGEKKKVKVGGCEIVFCNVIEMLKKLNSF